MAGSSKLAVICALAVAALAAAPSTAAAARPNIIVVVTDDQTLGMLGGPVMPKTRRLLARRGTTFTQAIVSTPQCCPSRAALLTGQYAHNNKVVANRPGYPLLNRKRQVLPAWLRASGYRTIHIGKFLNGYTGAAGFDPAPGWDTWRTVAAADYQNPVFSINGRKRGPQPVYLTTELNRMARGVIRARAPRRQPFYLQIDHLAPHIGSGDERGRCRGAAVPRAKDVAKFIRTPFPRTPATEESDLSDKPEFIQRQPPVSAEEWEAIDRRYACALGSLREVDRGVGTLISELRRAGELRRTMILFTSDNGYSFAEHRVQLTKGMTYEEHLRVPFIVRPPRGAGIGKRFRRGARLADPVANIDIAPTLLDLARAEPCVGGRCRRMDGRSLLPLLRGRDRAWTDTRAIRTSFDINFGFAVRSCMWDGLRTPSTTLVEHTSVPLVGGSACREASQFELYDLEADPFQLQGDLPVPEALVARLDSLRRCSGIPRRDRPLKARPYCE